MAKLNREAKLRDKRAVKAAKKDARKREAAADLDGPSDDLAVEMVAEEPDDALTA